MTRHLLDHCSGRLGCSQPSPREAAQLAAGRARLAAPLLALLDQVAEPSEHPALDGSADTPANKVMWP